MHMEGDSVERVLRRRQHPQRGLEYLVRWRGSDGSDDEWFPAISVENDYPELLDAFDAECEATGVLPDDGIPVMSSQQPTAGRIDCGVTNNDNAYRGDSVSQLGEPQYNWQSTSLPPPRMSKKEFKHAHKILSKYAIEKGLTKNYADVAVDYRKQVKYIARTDADSSVVGAHPSDPPTCCMCKKGRVELVFYPCQHACVCNKCVARHKIGVVSPLSNLDQTRILQGHDLPEKSTWNACPLCVSEIKRVVRLTNTSEQDYQKWVYDVKPPLDFMDRKRFATVGKMLSCGDTTLVKKDQRALQSEVGYVYLPTGELLADDKDSIRGNSDRGWKPVSGPIHDHNDFSDSGGCCMIS